MKETEFYEKLKNKLKTKVNPTVYTVWISPCSYHLSQGILKISTDSKLRCEVLKNEYDEVIKSCSRDLLGFDVILTFHVTDDKERECFEEDEVDNRPVCEFKKSDDEISRDIKSKISKQISLKAYNEWIKDADFIISKNSNNVIEQIKVCFPNKFKASIGSHFYKEIRASVNNAIISSTEIKITYSYYDNGTPVDIDFRLEEIDKENDILRNVLHYIQEYYKYTTVDPFVFDFLFKDNIKILEITHEEEQVDREERTIVSLNLQHKIIAEILQEHFRNEIACAFYDVMDADDIFIKYTVDGDDYTHRYGQWLDDYFIDGMK